jgi:hypothetical protein
MCRKGSLAAVLVSLVLLATAAPVMAFGFCFSFGSKVHDRPRYKDYLPPYPGVAAPLYPAYGYSPVLPAYDYDNIYYPLASPYVTVPPGNADR